MAAATTTAAAAEKPYFEQQRDHLRSEIALAMEHVLINMNALNRNLESIIAVIELTHATAPLSSANRGFGDRSDTSSRPSRRCGRSLRGSWAARPTWPALPSRRAVAGTGRTGRRVKMVVGTRPCTVDCPERLRLVCISSIRV